MKRSPTTRQYSALQHAFAVFNAELFDNSLPDCLITMQRKARTYGYFSYQRFRSDDGHSFTDEIAINPQFIASHGRIEALQTLVHEMVHLWQHHHGDPGRGRYHNKEFADKMESIGLMPSSTGKPGGARTGQNMADYPIPGGRFEKVAQVLLATDFKIPWADRHLPAELGNAGGPMAEGETGDQVQGPAPAPASKNKTKYVLTCPKSGKPVSVWGRPGLALGCVECGERYSPATS